MQQLLTSVFPYFVCPHQLGGDFFWGGEDVVGVLFHYVGKQGNMEGGEQKRLAKTKLCYSCIIFTIVEMVTFFVVPFKCSNSWETGLPIDHAYVWPTLNRNEAKWWSILTSEKSVFLLKLKS